MVTVLFDVGETLGMVHVSPQLDRMASLSAYSHVPPVLEQLRESGARLGVVSFGSDDTAASTASALTAAGLTAYFDANLILGSAELCAPSDKAGAFAGVAERAGCGGADSTCVFVAQDAQQRDLAARAGFLVAPHPLLISDVLQGARLHYLRIRIPAPPRASDWRGAVRGLPVVPLYVTGPEGSDVYAVATLETAGKLDDLGFEVDRLGGADPRFSTLYLLRDDRRERAGFLASEAGSSSRFAASGDAELVLASSAEGLFVALPASRSIEELHFEEAQHGHTQKLMPDPALLAPFGASPGARAASWIAGTFAESSLSEEDLTTIREISPGVVGAWLDRYTGVEPIDASGDLIRSRHILHPNNRLATERLAAHLAEIGQGAITTRLHRFVHEGRVLYNVVGDLAGASSDEIVLVTAHLDSTAAYGERPYDPARDAAPGADDDASGIAAVLAIASALKKVWSARRPTRTLRFVLFNAEEQGLVGSKAYARDQAALSAPIVGVFQMDMVGYRGGNEAPPRPFEVHVGYGPSSEVTERSYALARRLAKTTPLVSPGLSAPQIYRTRDPAAGRSDHASFQERGYAACTVSEDFFAGPASESPPEQPNPNYHKPGDRVVHLDYAADIARVVAAAALLAAGS